MNDRNARHIHRPHPEQASLDIEFSTARQATPDQQPDTGFAPRVTESLLRELRTGAKEWWYHAELRQRGQHAEALKLEHASIRSSIQEIRAARANDGWLQIGRGGASLHYTPNAHVEGLHSHHIRACIAAGIPTLDSRNMSVKDVYELAVRGPMTGFVDSSFGPDADGNLSTRQWRVIFDRYAARQGAVFHNYTPDPTPWHPLASSS